ncbi:MAG TPA: hypothetical protein VFU71_21525 [Burkholderiaceae bacterium]|nr:hypothetical protein [Burkholderiaceae bacterium]
MHQRWISWRLGGALGAALAVAACGGGSDNPDKGGGPSPMTGPFGPGNLGGNTVVNLIPEQTDAPGQFSPPASAPVPGESPNGGNGSRRP